MSEKAELSDLFSMLAMLVVGDDADGYVDDGYADADDDADADSSYDDECAPSPFLNESRLCQAINIGSNANIININTTVVIANLFNLSYSSDLRRICIALCRLLFVIFLIVKTYMNEKISKLLIIIIFLTGCAAWLYFAYIGCKKIYKICISEHTIQ